MNHLEYHKKRGSAETAGRWISRWLTSITNLEPSAEYMVGLCRPSFVTISEGTRRAGESRQCHRTFAIFASEADGAVLWQAPKTSHVTTIETYKNHATPFAC